MTVDIHTLRSVRAARLQTFFVEDEVKECFTLDGIVPSGAGVAQIEVQFVFNTDHSLRVSANDVQGNRTRALSVKKKLYLG